MVLAYEIKLSGDDLKTILIDDYVIFVSFKRALGVKASTHNLGETSHEFKVGHSLIMDLKSLDLKVKISIMSNHGIIIGLYFNKSISNIPFYCQTVHKEK